MSNDKGNDNKSLPQASSCEAATDDSQEQQDRERSNELEETVQNNESSEVDATTMTSRGVSSEHQPKKAHKKTAFCRDSHQKSLRRQTASLSSAVNTDSTSPFASNSSPPVWGTTLAFQQQQQRGGDDINTNNNSFVELRRIPSRIIPYSIIPSTIMSRLGTASSSSGADNNIDNNDGNNDSAANVTTQRQQQPCGSWTTVSINTPPFGEGAPPCPRSLHSAAVIGDNMYVFGGYDGQTRLNDFFSFSFTEMTWSTIAAEQPPTPRDRHVSVAYKDTFYVFGGFDGRSRVSDLHGYNTITQKWRLINSGNSIHAPSPRHSHSAVVFGNSMYVFGGYDGSYRCDMTEFYFVENQWIPIITKGRSPRPRYRATCVVCPSKSLMILFGGHDGTRHLADTHIFDFTTKTWTLLSTVESSPLPLPRDSHVSVLVQPDQQETTSKTTTALMYVFGGSTGSAMNDLYQLKMEFPAISATASSVVAKWSQILHPSDSSSVPRNRFCHVGVCYRESFYVFGGYDGTSRLNDFVCYDFDDGTEDYFSNPSSSAAAGMRPQFDLLMLPEFLHTFVNQSELSDVTFIVEGVHVYAHKLLLVRSSYFRAMFLGGTESQHHLKFKEASQKEIALDHVRLPIFLLLLTFLYTDQCALFSKEDVCVSLEDTMDLFVAADEFCVPRLKVLCEKKIVSSLTIENAASIFLAADLFSADDLKRKTLKYILNHFEQVSKTVTFEEMARSNVDLVLEILRKRS